ncbi:MAG: DegT/DnrJ/EryC1/StrS family aminotransferase [Acidimicrobiia bacterium]
MAIDGGAPVRNEFMPFGVPSITDDEINEVVDTLKSGWIGTGHKAQRFEHEFARYTGADHAVAVSSCTAALHLALLALDCGPGDEVVTSDLTFVATTNAILHSGATPVVADVDATTWNVTAETLAAACSPRTKALLPVHFGGLACELDAIYDFADEHGIAVVEDCAHAVGTERRGRRLGSTPGVSCFSFYANKNLTTSEGGMLTTPAEDLAARIVTWRLHGLDQDAWHRFQTTELLRSWCTYPGFKYNLTDLAASLGIHQLARLDTMLEQRESLATQLDPVVDSLPGASRQPRPTDRSEGRHGLHLYAITIDPSAFTVDRDHVVQALRAENIGAAIHYEPVHRHPYYEQLLGVGDADRPVASAVGSTILSLPLTPAMSPADLDDVANALERVLVHYRR